MATCIDPKTCRTDCLFTGVPCTGAIPEQSPYSWPGNYGGGATVAERIALASLGYPTEVDGDAIAIARGPLERIAAVYA